MSITSWLSALSGYILRSASRWLAGIHTSIGTKSHGSIAKGSPNPASDSEAKATAKKSLLQKSEPLFWPLKRELRRPHLTIPLLTSQIGFQFLKETNELSFSRQHKLKKQPITSLVYTPLNHQMSKGVIYLTVILYLLIRILGGDEISEISIF